MRRLRVFGLAVIERPRPLPLRVSAGISPDFPRHLACSVVLVEVTVPRRDKAVNNSWLQGRQLACPACWGHWLRPQPCRPVSSEISQGKPVQSRH